MITAYLPDVLASCPFLAPVMADHLWMRPIGLYCRPPGGRVRVCGDRTLSDTCTTGAHLDCDRYRAIAGPLGTPAHPLLT
jgi:hypothetical protein